MVGVRAPSAETATVIRAAQVLERGIGEQPFILSADAPRREEGGAERAPRAGSRKRSRSESASDLARRLIGMLFGPPCPPALGLLSGPAVLLRQHVDVLLCGRGHQGGFAAHPVALASCGDRERWRTGKSLFKMEELPV